MHRKARFNKRLAQEARSSWVDFEVGSTRSNSVAYYSQESATHSVPLRVQYQNVIPEGDWIPSNSLGGLENRASFLDQGSFTGDAFRSRISEGSVASAYGS